MIIDRQTQIVIVRQNLGVSGMLGNLVNWLLGIEVKGKGLKSTINSNDIKSLISGRILAI